MACPCGFSQFKELCYARTARASGGYATCSSLCQQLHSGAKVGCVRDAAADSFIQSTFPSYCGLTDGTVNGGDCLYIGFVQASGSGEPDEGWGWDDASFCSGSSGPTYTGWESGQPNESKGSTDLGLKEQCAAYGWERSMLWWDLPCNQAYQCLCESPQLSKDDPAACTDTVSTGSFVGVIVGAVAVIVVIVGVFMYLHKRSAGPRAEPYGARATAAPVAQAAQVDLPVVHATVVEGVPVTNAASAVVGRAV